MSSYFKLNPHATKFVPKPNTADQSSSKWQASVKTQAHQSDVVNPSAQAAPPQANGTDAQAAASQINGDLYSLLHKQNEVTALLVQMQSSQFLLGREMPIFDGDHLQFRTFIKSP